MLAQLCMIYTLCLVLITTIVVGVPQEEVPQNLTLSHNAHIFKRDSYPECDDERYHIYQSSYCWTIHAMSVTCESDVFDTQTHIQDCRVNEFCIDFFYLNDPTPHAQCVSQNNIRQWSNGHNSSAVCSADASFVGVNTDLSLGLSTYATNGNPIQVLELDIYVKGNLFGRVSTGHNLSKIYNNYQGEDVKYCFASGTDQTVDAIAAALIMKTKTSVSDKAT